MKVDVLRNKYNEYRKHCIVFEYDLKSFLVNSFEDVHCCKLILGDCTHNFMVQMIVKDKSLDINSPIIHDMEERFGLTCEELSHEYDGFAYVQFIEKNVFNR